MSWKPRLLAAVGIGLGALGLVQAGRLALDATNAFAAGEEAKEEAKGDAAAAPGAGDAAAAGTETAAAEGPPMCIPVDLAREAGISAAEFRLLQSLQERRQALDARERDIVTREGVLKTADDRITERMAALREAEASIQRLLGQMDEAETARITQLVSTYEKMRPRDAARVLEGLDDETLRKIVIRMKPTVLGAILAQMPAQRAREVTVMLAEVEAPDLSALSRAPAAAAPPPAAARPAGAAARPGETRTASAPAAPAAGAAAGAAGQGAAARPPAQSGAGPTPPTAPTARTPTAPTAPQPTARAASGQAPADPPQGKGGGG